MFYKVVSIYDGSFDSESVAADYNTAISLARADFTAMRDLGRDVPFHVSVERHYCGPGAECMCSQWADFEVYRYEMHYPY